MKKANLFKSALCVLALLPMGAWAIDFGTEEVVSTTTTWTFDGLTATTQYSSYTETNGLYLRSNQTGRSFTVTGGTATAVTFKDGYVENVTNYLAVNNNATYSNSDALTATSTAGDGTSAGRGMVAINASVAGTFYVKIKGGTTGKVIRVYFANGTSIVGSSATSITSDGTIQEISYTSTEAGSFFVGGLTTGTSEIYAARFVPTSEKKDEWVYIGETGYATWGNTSGKDIDALPDGLTAYKATAASDAHSVMLTSLDKMRRGQGYVISGTPNTNYGLTYGGETLGTEYNGGDMVRVSADMENFAATADGKNRYILGNDGGTAKFFTPSGTGTLKKGKAYLQTTKTLSPADPSAPGIMLVIDNGTTGISNVNATVVSVGKYYNLQGIEVAQPTRGIYIVNGKKVFIK